MELTDTFAPLAASLGLGPLAAVFVVFEGFSGSAAGETDRSRRELRKYVMPFDAVALAVCLMMMIWDFAI